MYLNLILNIVALLEEVNAILSTLLSFRKHCILITQNLPYETFQKPSI